MPIKLYPVGRGGISLRPLEDTTLKEDEIAIQQAGTVPPRHQDPAHIIGRAGETGEQEPLGPIKYAGARILSSVIEKPAWALTEGLFRVGRFNFKIMGLENDKKIIDRAKKSPRWAQAIEALPDRFEGWLDRQIEFYSQPEKYGLITPRAESTREKVREAAYQRSIARGIGADIAESAIDLGALLLQMSAVGAPAKLAKGKTGATLVSGNQLAETLKHFKRMGAHAIATTSGTMTDRVQSGLYRIGYNMTPYIANSLGVVGWTAVATDTMLNTFITSPVYYKAIKRAGGLNEESLSVIAPQLVMDIAMAWNTRGLPENQARAAWAKRANLLSEKYKVSPETVEIAMKAAHGDIDRLVDEGHIRPKAEVREGAEVRPEVRSEIRPEVRPEARAEIDRTEVYKGMEIVRGDDGRVSVYDLADEGAPLFVIKPDEVKSGLDITEQTKQSIDELRILEKGVAREVSAEEKKRPTNQEKIRELEQKLEETKGFLERGKIREEIEALKENKTIEQYRKDKEEAKNNALKEREEKQNQLKEQKIKEIEQKRKQLEEDIKNAPKEKLEQYEIIKENNPMLDDYHVGIRSPKDIKSFSQVINDDESFSWGDFSKKDAEKALKKGEITIYSSYSIEQGTFVSTSKIQAEQYAGGKKVYTKTVSLEDVAWINGDEGQFAKVKKCGLDITEQTKQSIDELRILEKGVAREVSAEERALIVPTKKEINELARGLRDEDIARSSIEEGIKPKTLKEYREQAEQMFLDDKRAQSYLNEMRESESDDRKQRAREKLEDRRDVILGRAVRKIQESDLDRVVKERLSKRISEIGRINPDAITRAEIKVYQDEVYKMIKGLEIPKGDKDSLSASIKRANTATTLVNEMRKIRERAEVYTQSAEKRDVRKKINREIKFTKPVKRGVRRVGKYDYSTNKLVDELRNINKYTQDKAQAELDAMEKEGLSESDLIKARLLSYKANGMKGSVELHRQVLKDIQYIKETGEKAKGEADFIKKLQREEVVSELTESLDKNITSPKNFRTKLGNVYRLGFSNTYSMLNSIFGREVARKYDPELNQMEKHTSIFYKVEETQRAISEIMELEKPVQVVYEFARMEDDKMTLIDRDGLEVEVSKLGLMDIYNSVKNDLIRERYYNGFGEEEIKLALQTLTPAEKRVADFMMESLQEYGEVLNERAIEITGRDNGRVKNYWPSTAEFMPDVFDDVRLQGETPSAMKGRIKNSKIMPRPVNAWTKWMKHISEGEHVRHLSREYENLSRLFQDRRVRGRITRNYGDKVYNNLMKQIDNISLNKNRASIDAVSEVFGKYINNWTKAKTSASPTVFTRQLMSVINYAEHMPSGEWAKGFFDSMKNPKRTFNYMWRNSPYLRARFSMGYSEALARAIEGTSLLKTRGENFSDALTVFGRAGDISAIIYGGESYVRHLMKPVSEGGRGMSKDEAFKEFEWATLKGQQSPFSAGLSEFQNSHNPIARLFLAFQNTNNQAFRKIVDDTIGLYNKDITADQWAKTFTIHGILRSLTYVWAGQLTTEGFKGVGRLVRGEKKEETDFVKDAMDELYINLMVLPVIATPIIEDLVDYAARLAFGKPAYDPINMPMLDDITMAVQKARKKEITLEDYFDMFSVPAEMGSGLPLKTFKRFFKLVVGEKEKPGKRKKTDSKSSLMKSPPKKRKR